MKQKTHVPIHASLILYVWIVIFSPFISFAQDKIYKTDNSLLEVKVQEVGNTEIKYKKFSNLNGPVYSLLKSEIKMIVYENGEKEVYNQSTSVTNIQPLIPIKARAEDKTMNDDFIITENKDTIFCTIDRISSNAIKYHIIRRGTDQEGEIEKLKLIQYYNHEFASIYEASEKARHLILTENINLAIVAYAELLKKDSTNAVLYAEDAYALALGGVYEVALMRLDQSWNLRANSPDVNYLTGQVFLLMGNDELAKEVWKYSEIYKVPAWIAPKAPVFLQKYKNKTSGATINNKEALMADFKRANDFAAQHFYFQSIALFYRIITLYPDEYLPYIGYSITLEKTGALEKSAQAMEKAISLLGNNPEVREKKEFLEQHLIVIRQRMATIPLGAMPGIIQNPATDFLGPQMMAYTGFMLSPSRTMLNARIGYYIAASSNASFDVGYMKISGKSFTNLGFALYNRNKNMVSGGGLMMTRGNDITSFYLKLSTGLSMLNKKKTSSFDFFIDINLGLKKESYSTFSISLGKSIYFGKRK